MVRKTPNGRLQAGGIATCILVSGICGIFKFSSPTYWLQTQFLPRILGSLWEPAGMVCVFVRIFMVAQVGAMPGVDVGMFCILNRAWWIVTRCTKVLG